MAETAAAREAEKMAGQLNPDVLLLNLTGSSGAAMEGLQRICRSQEHLRAVVLLADSDKSRIADAFRAGARGAVAKDSPARVVVDSVRSVAAGRFWVFDHAVKDLAAALQDLAEPARAAAVAGLTRREIEIVSAIVSGYSNREIAGKLSISEETVKHHLTNIFDKVGVYNRLELALFAIHHGLIEKKKPG